MNPSSPSRFDQSGTTVRPRRGREISSETVTRQNQRYYDDPSPERSPPRSREGSPMPRLPPMRRAANGKVAATANSSSSLWDSGWSAIQSLAGSMLSNEPEPSDQGWGNGIRRPRTASASGRKQWGPAPTVTDVVGTGFTNAKEDRDAIFRAKKREALLAAAVQDESFQARYKRRMSPDRAISSSVPSMGRTHDGPDMEDTLVYIYHVRKQDTLAGVVILFGCSGEVFRKANRFWPNDSIQTRRAVVVPVESCTIKSTPIDPTEPRFRNNVDSIPELLEDAQEVSSSQLTSVKKDLVASPSLSEPLSYTWASPRSATFAKPSDLPEYTHVSWVALASQPNLPIEVARLPRVSLSHFPTPNRWRASSRASSREPSLDIERRHSQQPTIARKMPAFGIGSLDVDSPFKRTAPGPPDDLLNKIFGPHLPSTSRPDSGTTTPTQFERSIERSIENMGGAMETFVRKIVNKTSTLIDTPNESMGDLIELGETPGIEEEERGRGRELPAAMGSGLGVKQNSQQLRNRKR